MKIPCNIVQDLLPSYIDELCSEETKKQLGEHLAECEACDAKYKEMKGELPEELKPGAGLASVEEIQPMKKIKKRHVGQIFCLVAVVVAVVIAGSVFVVKGSSEGYNKGYTEGTDEGYNTGYTAGTDEGYSTGYTKGYVDGTAENPDLLTMKVETRSIGEQFSNLWALMQEKWGVDENLRVVVEEGQEGFSLLYMHLCLLDESAAYVVETYRGYEDSDCFYTIEVRRMEADALEVQEEAFRFKALVDCMEAFGFELKEDKDINKQDYVFTFDNKLMKDYPVVGVMTGEGMKGWVYENGEARECVEETRLEGYGAYYLLNIVTVGLTQDSSYETPVYTQVYIEMK